MSEKQSADAAAQRVDTRTAHNARVWNYWQGGKDNYEVDRQVGEHVAGMIPVIRDIARADREFLGRAVRRLAREHGIRQFLDIGTGLPALENTHEIAQRIAPASRIVYVDNDPIVLAHARTLLTSAPEGATDYIDADVHDPDAILRIAGDTLDLTEPTALMLLGILNFVLDDGEARAIAARLVEALPSGSFLVLTHPTTDPDLGGDLQLQAMDFWNANAKPPVTARGSEEVARYFEGLTLLEPGLVSCSRWHPEPGEEPAVVPQLGAVARKR
ncbi:MULTISPECIES: SAM-dependent methyltransferase [unclassified Streptomyces]|uniref:SAM-dependent methyltransferase n=1 Tax=unclassified Streptomyces TaxID=2593676 RepID=UPI000DDC0572|nr:MULTISPECIES: SAM-dependent methyltransferase [unclassified Streptomyces]QZZ31393.1 SAM-dependent methyltransferase [Streptomyces sp. ST1015]